MLLKLGVKKVEDDEISQLSAQGVESMSSSVQDDCEVALPFKSEFSTFITLFIGLCLFSS